jgi:hypothetical protein
MVSAYISSLGQIDGFISTSLWTPQKLPIADGSTQETATKATLSALEAEWQSLPVYVSLAAPSSAPHIITLSTLTTR